MIDGLGMHRSHRTNEAHPQINSFCTNRRTCTKSHPLARTSPCMPVSAKDHIDHILRASLGDLALYRDATAIAAAPGVCVILIDAVPTPLKCAEVVLPLYDPVDRVVADNSGATSAAVPRAPSPCNCPRFWQRFGHRAPLRLRLDRGPCEGFSRWGMALDERGQHILEYK